MPDPDLTTIAHEEGKVILPFKEEQFYEFLKSLLGQPQTIGRSFKMPYAISPEDVAHLHGLVVQRVSQQNPSRLLDFSGKIAFSDESTVTFKSLESLLTYNEVKRVVSTRLELTWVYLVTFQDKHSPERQEISVVFRSGSYGRARTFTEERMELRETHERPLIQLEIRHSARTWGADLEHLVSNFINTLEKEEPGGYSFLRQWEGALGLIIALLFFSSAIGTTIWTLSRAASRYRSELAAILPSQGVLDPSYVPRYLEFISKFMINSSTSIIGLNVVLYCLIAMVGAAAAGAITVSLVPPKLGGYVLFTKLARAQYEKALEQQSNTWRNVALSCAVAFALSVAANFAFAWLTK